MRAPSPRRSTDHVRPPEQIARSVENQPRRLGGGDRRRKRYRRCLRRRTGQARGAVVCSDIDEAAAQRTADAITERGAKAVAIRCDVSRFEEVQALAEQSQAWFAAPPTLVINNAGVGAGGAAIGEAPLDDWLWTLGINLWGPIHGCHVFTPILREAEPSRAPRGIINVASAAAF